VNTSSPATEAPGSGLPAFVFVIEQTLGNAVHGRNIARAVAERTDIRGTVIPLEQGRLRAASRLPVVRSWSFEASLAARRALRRHLRQGGMDAALIHTQVSSLLSCDIMHSVPTVISLDATPINYDSVGESYGHKRHLWVAEELKRRVNQRAFLASTAVVAFSRWAAESVVRDYGVAEERVHVIRPGVDLQKFQPGPEPTGEHRPRILFVGADFNRKGGPDLLKAMQRIGDRAELDIVTATAPPIPHGLPVRVHLGLTHDSSTLFELYRNADIFAFPSRGDCLPHVVSEAVACGLPVVACDVGAIGEIAVDGHNALLVPASSPDCLAEALLRLVEQPALRREFRQHGLEFARRELDGDRNLGQVFDLMRQISSAPRRSPTRGNPGSPKKEPPAVARRLTSGPGRAVMLVSANAGPELRAAVTDGLRPCPEFLRLEQRYGVQLIDWTKLPGSRGRRCLPQSMMHVLACLRSLGHTDAVLSDGEHVGIPLAGVLRAMGSHAPRHVMIGHSLFGRKKMWALHALARGRWLDQIVVHSPNQVDLFGSALGVDKDWMTVAPYGIDTEFWRQDLASPEDGPPFVMSAGREHRDYGCLTEACPDQPLFITDHSAHSPHATRTQPPVWPANVTRRSLTPSELRDTYAAAAVVVVPVLQSEVPFGITAVLEAMSMGKAVVVSGTRGLAGVVDHGRTGLVVPPGDVPALREAVTGLLASPAERRRLGEAARESVVRRNSLDLFVDSLAASLGIGERPATERSYR
jgi:glycosyltransferase involved in cell wall biosynthesis